MDDCEREGRVHALYVRTEGARRAPLLFIGEYAEIMCCEISRPDSLPYEGRARGGLDCSPNPLSISPFIGGEERVSKTFNHFTAEHAEDAERGLKPANSDAG